MEPTRTSEPLLLWRLPATGHFNGEAKAPAALLNYHTPAHPYYWSSHGAPPRLRSIHVLPVVGLVTCTTSVSTSPQCTLPGLAGAFNLSPFPEKGVRPRFGSKRCPSPFLVAFSPVPFFTFLFEFVLHLVDPEP